MKRAAIAVCAALSIGAHCNQPCPETVPIRSAGGYEGPPRPLFVHLDAATEDLRFDSTDAFFVARLKRDDVASAIERARKEERNVLPAGFGSLDARRWPGPDPYDGIVVVPRNTEAKWWRISFHAVHGRRPLDESTVQRGHHGECLTDGPATETIAVDPL